MPYLGNPPAEAYTSTVKDSFSGDGSTTAFTLSQPSTTNDLRVVVENVIQDPTVAYSVSGTTLTFTSAPPSGTDNIYAVNLGPAVQTVVPPDGVTVTDLNAYADGAVAFTANRASSDGTIIDLQKNGSTVGSIGYANAPEFYIGAGDTGLGFGDAVNQIYPVNPSTNGHRDAAVDLGNSGIRFKDLYLSGGVYLGGTGSSNLLDDYEIGDFTPRITLQNNGTGVTHSVQDGKYVKVGNKVTVWIVINLTSKGTHSSGTAVYVSDLPFTVDNWTSNTSLDGGGGIVGYFGNTSGIYGNFSAIPSGGTTDLFLFAQSSSGATSTSNVTWSRIDNTFQMRCECTYYV